LKVLDDRVVFTGRYPLKLTANPPPESLLSQGSYEEVVTALDCNKPVSQIIERTVFNKSNEVISHYRREEPVDFANGTPNPPGSIISIADHVLCSESLRASLGPEVADKKLTYLSTSSNGDSELFYGPTKTLQVSGYNRELIFVARNYQDHAFADMFPGQNVVGLPQGYRYMAEILQLNCTDRKLQLSKTEYLDKESNREYLFAPLIPQPLDYTPGSPFSMLLNKVCGAQVAGHYEGMNYATYKDGANGEQRIGILVQQNGNDLSISFQAAPSGQGKGTATL
jgi:hypothetical protein